MKDKPSSRSDPQSALEIPDEFAAGKENRLHRVLFRFVRWLFLPPYLPSALTWILVALIASNVSLDLLRQHRAYWIDPGVSWRISSLGVDLRNGPWAVLIVYAGFALVCVLGLTFISRRMAFPIWTVLTFTQVAGIAELFSCGMSGGISFINANNCSQVYGIALVFGGLIWAGCLGTAVALGVFRLAPKPQQNEHTSGSRLSMALRIGSFAWILFLGGMVVYAATQAQPEWRQILPAYSPSARMQAATAYDTDRRRAILFGGTDTWSPATDWNEIGDTWEWDGVDWAEISPVDRPSPRRGAGMAYDETRQVIVLFGGYGRDASNQPVYYGDTWEWNGENWIKRSSAGSPHERSNPNLFFDESRGKIVLYAGYYQDEYGKDVFLNDVWEWDGLEWTLIPMEEAKANSASALVYYPGRQVPILVDGEGVWFMQYSRWYQPNYPRMPRGRWQSWMALDLDHQEVILFGGYQEDERLNDTWSYNGSAWTKIVTRTTPAARFGHTLFYDMARHTVVLFGGNDGVNLHQDMWELIQP